MKVTLFLDIFLILVSFFLIFIIIKRTPTINDSNNSKNAKDDKRIIILISICLTLFFIENIFTKIYN